MASSRPPSIDPQALVRWRQRAPEASPWLHEEVAQRMQDRLDYILTVPARWLDWEPVRGGLQAHRALQKRYASAQDLLWEASPKRLAHARAALTPPWWRLARWRRPVPKPWQDEQPGVQMLWANMSLHADAEPAQTLAQWHAALATDGFLMFSCLGPDTLKELRAVYQAMGWPAPHHDYTDMHDLGDMLAGAGFAEPVMSMEHITLTFTSAERLLQELQGLGKNWHVQRFQGLRTLRWRERLLAALQQLADPRSGGQLALTFEVIYGHAFKPAATIPLQAQSTVSLENMRDMLRKRS
jgi:malonyl-CoA O-methyltransferase